MNRLSTVPIAAFFAEGAALAFPPVAGRVLVVPAGQADLPQFDVELASDAAGNLTLTTIYGAVPEALVVVDQATTFSAATDLATHVAHGLKLGDGPLNYTSTLTLPPELATAGATFYAVPASADTYKLATSRENALNNVTIDLTGAGTGVITLHDQADTTRLRWHQVALLGSAGDGALSLDVQLGYRATIAHRPRVVAYAVGATISAGNVGASLYGVVDA